MLVKVAHHRIVIWSRSLRHRLLHVALGTEAHQIIFAVAIEGVGGDPMYVIHLELAYRSALGTPALLLFDYIRAKHLRWVLAFWAQ